MQPLGWEQITEVPGTFSVQDLVRHLMRPSCHSCVESGVWTTVGWSVYLNFFLSTLGQQLHGGTPGLCIPLEGIPCISNNPDLRMTSFLGALQDQLG